MSLIVRTILILTLLIQSMPGLVMQQCVAMPEASSLVAAGGSADAKCACCNQGTSDATVECPMAKQGYAGCNCRNPQPEPPRTPPEQKTSGIDQWTLTAPVLLAALLPEPPEHVPAWPVVSVPRWQSPSSIHALLCVWHL